MKENYKKSISLSCNICGNKSFEFNKNKSWVKCKKCNKEYHGGYNELVELNKFEINKQLDEIKNEVRQDMKLEIKKILKDTFNKNKNIKFK